MPPERCPPPPARRGRQGTPRGRHAARRRGRAPRGPRPIRPGHPEPRRAHPVLPAPPEDHTAAMDAEVHAPNTGTVTLQVPGTESARPGEEGQRYEGDQGEGVRG